MSRVGLNPIVIPEGVKYDFKEQLFSVENEKGNLSLKLDIGFEVTAQDSDSLIIKRPNDKKDSKAKHGLYRSLIANMFEGLSKGFRKELELHGVGYRASNQGQKLELLLGFSHGIVFELPDEIKVSCESERGKNPIVTLESHDKQLIGHVAAKIRSLRKPEPYKGKGIKFVGEQLRRKAGKSAAK